MQNKKLSDTFDIELLSVTPKSAKILLDNVQSNKNKASPTIVSEDNNILKSFTIQLYAKTIKENYLEFYVDGKEKVKGLISKGRTIELEAENSIQIKIGDASGVELMINGKKVKKGKIGQQVNKVIKKVKDPSKPYQYKIEVNDF